MGQAKVRRWADDLLPLPIDGDPLGVDGFATHRLPLDAAPEAYKMFLRKRGGRREGALPAMIFRGNDRADLVAT